jgi:hypothetical protein
MNSNKRKAIDDIDQQQEISKPKLSNSIVTLNISGTKFQCDTVIFQRFPDTVLGRMFASENSSLIKSDSDGFFFDRDPDIFKHILNWYRSGILSSLLFNNNLFDNNIARHELQAWGIMLHSIETQMDLEIHVAWNQTKLFLEDFIKSKNFIGELPNFYFQRVTPRQFNSYFNVTTQTWCSMPSIIDKMDDIKTIESVIEKYWKCPSNLDPLLYGIYQKCFDDTHSDINEDIDDSKAINLELLQQTLKNAIDTKIASEFTELLYSNIEGLGNKEKYKLTYLKEQIVMFFNNNGYKSVWKEHTVKCKDDQYNICNIFSYISHYPFNLDSVSNDSDTKKYPIPWCNDCHMGIAHKSIDITIPYLEITRL